MTPSERRSRWQLSVALSISVIAHALPFLPDLFGRSRPPPKPPLQARLLPMQTAVPPPPLIVPEALPEKPATPRAPPPPKRASSAPAPPRDWNEAVARQMRQLQRSGSYYSAEAVAQGLEGDPLVLFVLDEDGNVTAARIEASSGHALLDRDALNAVRRLRSLPADAPREAVLKLRFRLKD